MAAPQRHVKCALFVDFDNIYLGLKEIDPAAAEQYATDPARWLDWFVRGMPTVEEESGPPSERRAVLIRRCYLNPRTFYRYRPYFTRSAFSVIDCPPLTGKGKNSSDIHMVMDILDTLHHSTRFDEFIILSGDADFTPVLLRLRAHDRRTVILTIGQAAEAYKAACDWVISEDVFVEDALGLSTEFQAHHSATEPPVSGDLGHLLDTIAHRVYEEASANGELLATELPRIYREFPEFRRNTNWLGFFSLRALTQELVRRHPDLRMGEGDPWRVSVPMRSAVAVLEPLAPEPAETAAASVVVSSDQELQERIIAQVRAIVGRSNEPVLMAKVAHQVVTNLGPQVIERRWTGAGTFKALLQSVEGLGLEMATFPHPGYLYDPNRHEPPAVDAEERPGKWPPHLHTLAQRVSRVTGTPRHTPEEYAVIFQAMAEELAKNRYNLTATSKAVRDLCIERGHSISRANVSFVLRGITYTGYRFGRTPGADTPWSLARAFRSDVTDLCNDAQLELAEQEHKLLDEWILGELEPERPKSDLAA